VKNFNYFMDDEFCQHCEGGGECKNAWLRDRWDNNWWWKKMCKIWRWFWLKYFE
jgi:hypothetical protein